MNTAHICLTYLNLDLHDRIQRFFLTFIWVATARAPQVREKACYTELKMIYFHAFASPQLGLVVRSGMNESLLFVWMDETECCGAKWVVRQLGGFTAALWRTQIIIKRRVEESKTANKKLSYRLIKICNYWFALACNAKRIQFNAYILMANGTNAFIGVVKAHFESIHRTGTLILFFARFNGDGDSSSG